jgi:CelD/BcsL family acetyltransferase involved in cellulose biosynthesis
MPDITARLHKPAEMAAADVAAWVEVQAESPVFSNPLFSHAFAAAVAEVRDDVEVAVFRQGAKPVAFLAVHRRRGGLARPIGAPFSDYQGIVSKGAIGLSGPQALERAGLGAIRFNGLVDPYGLFAGAAGGVQEAFAIELDGDPDAYLEAVRAASPKKFKNYRRLEHRLEREVGPLRLVGGDRSQDAFDAILAWKSEQFTRTGIQDVLRPVWVRRMMQSLFETSRGEVTGLMVSLYAGETLVAGHFGIRQGAVFHPWIASANPEFASVSPGQLFLGHAIRAMPRLGVTVYDLGPGHDHYKRPYASVRRELGVGLVVADGVRGRMAGASEAAWSMSGLGRVAALDKVRRRLDHIAAIDPSPAGRVRGVLEAVQGVRRRGLGNEPLRPEGA